MPYLHRLMLRFVIWVERLLARVTVSLLRADQGVLKYLVEETGEVICARELERAPRYWISGFVRGSPQREVPREVLPKELSELRFCGQCERYSFFMRCPWCGYITVPCEYYLE